MPEQSIDTKSTKLKREPDAIMAELDRWVTIHGDGQYSSANFQPFDELSIGPDYSIQQVREELHDLVSEIINRGLSKTILEIGLGHYGSTHFLWRLLFERVVTIERSSERCRDFARRYSSFTNGIWPTSDGSSGFIFGLSSDPISVSKAYSIVKYPIDVLFIDGDHRYEAILCDWLLYHRIVRKGGIVVFHDCANYRPEQSGVPAFLQELQKGELDGTPRALHRILHSKNVGIAFYERT